MLARRLRVLLGLCVSMGLIVLPMAAWSASAAAAPKLPQVGVGHVISATGLRQQTSVRMASIAATGPKLKTFTSTVVDTGVTYKYTIVGKNPAVASASPSTTIPTELVPVNIVFSGFANWDPTVADSCDSGATALSRTQLSPIIKTHSYTWGGTAIGSAQYVDAFQRAEFWTYANPSGINPGYHVKLKVTTLPTVTINVPLADAAAATTGCGNGFLGAVEINWLDNYLQTTAIPALVTAGVAAPNTFPIFLLHNVVEYIGTTSNCCALGYHNAYKPSAASQMQTYAVADYDNSGAFGTIDVSVLAHEVGEWMDDPNTNNPTRPWGHIGQVSGCQNNLEVGDPLSGTTLTVSMNGFKYHPQEMAFFSWFYRQHPSLGVNGWYSNKGTFTTTQGTCA